MDDNPLSLFDSKRNLAKLGFNKVRIAIKDRWFDVLTPSELVRQRNKKDGYFRVVYIQINMENGEYYIVKANRPKWSELQRYQGVRGHPILKAPKTIYKRMKIILPSASKSTLLSGGLLTVEESRILSLSLCDMLMNGCQASFIQIPGFE